MNRREFFPRAVVAALATLAILSTLFAAPARGQDEPEPAAPSARLSSIAELLEWEPEPHLLAPSQLEPEFVELDEPLVLDARIRDSFKQPDQVQVVAVFALRAEPFDEIVSRAGEPQSLAWRLHAEHLYKPALREILQLPESSPAQIRKAAVYRAFDDGRLQPIDAYRPEADGGARLPDRAWIIVAGTDAEEVRGLVEDYLFDLDERRQEALETGVHPPLEWLRQNREAYLEIQRERQALEKQLADHELLPAADQLGPMLVEYQRLRAQRTGVEARIEAMSAHDSQVANQVGARPFVRQRIEAEIELAELDARMGVLTEVIQLLETKRRLANLVSRMNRFHSSMSVARDEATNSARRIWASYPPLIAGPVYLGTPQWERLSDPPILRSRSPTAHPPAVPPILREELLAP